MLRTILRVLAAVLVTAALCAFLWAPRPTATHAATPAGERAPREIERAPGATPGVQRVSGADRYEGSARASAAMGLTHADTVYVASGETFPDALSAASVAGINGAPLLLTARDRLPDPVRRELARLSPDTIVIVGGELAVTDVVALELSRAVSGATVTRVAGADRYEVSRRLVSDTAVGATGSPWLVVATGREFADALSAAPAAAAVSSPVVLLDGAEAMPTPAERVLLRDLDITTVLIAGGPASVSASLETELARSVLIRRFAGADRFATSVALNAVFSASDVAYVASGQSFPDALSGAPLAAHDDAPLYLARQDCVPRVVLDDLDRLGVSRVVLLGGPLVLGSGVAALTPCP